VIFEKFKVRSHEPERLDTGDYTADEYGLWQKEMAFIHRFFGEKRALRNSLIADIRRSGSRSVSILDVGAGSGDLLRDVNKKIDVEHKLLVGVELGHEAAASIQADGVLAVRSNAASLPFADHSFDYTFCTLMLHHLSDEAAIDLLREMERITRFRLIVVDLERSALSYYLYRAFGRVFLQRFTFDDGSLSIRRSFTRNELTSIGKQAGLTNFEVRNSAVGRLVASAGAINGAGE
jgi:ubiquinone/menaquinone biosynthesis C-methylase UbiE